MKQKLYALLLSLATATSLRAELVLYYDFEEGAGTVIHNQGANGTPGNFVGGNSEGSWSQGRPGYGKAIELHGGDASATWSGLGCGEFGVCSVHDGVPADVRFVDTEVSFNQLNVNGDATFMAWVRWDGHVVVQHFADLFGVSSRTGSGSGSRTRFPLDAHAFSLMLWAIGEQMSFHALNKSTIMDVSRVDSDLQDGDLIGEWIHIAWQLREEEVQIFVDGDPIFDVPQAFQRTEHSGTLQVGFWAWQTFNGLIDEVKIFDEARSAAQIAVDMAPPMAANPSLEVLNVVDLGQVPFFQSATESIRVSNTGSTEPLILDSADFVDTSIFQVESYPQRLEPGEVSEIRINADATDRAGQRHGRLEIRSNDARGALTTIAVSVSTDNQSSLITHLPFDQDADSRLLRNYAPLGDPASADGEIAFGQPGLNSATGQSARFSGGVVRASDPFGGSLSVALWVQPEEVDSGIQTICAAGNAKQPAWALTLMDGRLAWFGGGNTTETPDYLSPTQIVDRTAPFHLAASIERTVGAVKVQWLVNGMPQESGVELLGTDDSVGNLLFVGAFGDEKLPFLGRLDDVQVYDGLLTREEMAALYSNPGETLATLGVPDSDGDGLLDENEAERSTDPLAPDSDGDGLGDGEEVILGINPLARDSDGGGTWDGVEVQSGTDPLASADDPPIWTIHTAALRAGSKFESVDRSLTGLDVVQEFTFQRQIIDFEDEVSPFHDLFPGGEDLDDIGLTLQLQQVFFITGRITVEQGGVYTLGVARDNAFRLLIDGELHTEIISPRRGIHPIAVALAPGVHEIEVHWVRGEFLELFHWEDPGDFTEEPPLKLAVPLRTAQVDDVDTDGDELPDFWELAFAGNLDLGRDDDPDGDGLSMKEEFIARTNPVKPDTDDDGLNDAAELQAGTNPHLRDTDGDGLLDVEELATFGTDPLMEDSDHDGLPDGFETGKSLDPLGEGDDSLAFLTLDYTFETGSGIEVENLAGGPPGVLYSWNVDSAWGAGDASDSRGSGFLRITPPDPEVEATNVNLLDEIEGLIGDEISDGSTIVATSHRPEDAGIAESYTIMAWTRSKTEAIFSFGGRRLLSQPGENRLYIGFDQLRLLQSNGLESPAMSTLHVSEESWHHVAWRYHRGEVTMYIDGKESARVLNRRPIANPHSQFLIGWFVAGHIGFIGGVDDLRIYSAPLTEAKIFTLAGSPPPEERTDGLSIISFTRDRDRIEMTWSNPGVNQRYRVEYSETLRGDWAVIGTVLSTANPTASYADIDAGRLRKREGYYRIQIQDN